MNMKSIIMMVLIILVALVGVSNALHTYEEGTITLEEHHHEGEEHTHEHEEGEKHTHDHEEDHHEESEEHNHSE
ncbi:hypothetical protein [Methanosphaera sp.]|uniref:hypothetical protein n=1 Tax=Methanosphaera sp. TaxID=2666342 RepID=UPI0025F2C05F|nr:hypothetical protein [Methanosphaera sp.]